MVGRRINMKIYRKFENTKYRCYLTTIDQALNAYDTLKIRDDFYIVSFVNLTEQYAEVKLEDGFSMDEQVIRDRENFFLHGCDVLYCPVCGRRIDDPPHDSTTIYCPNCGAELLVEVECTVTYNPSVIQLPNIIEVNQ